MGPDALQAAAGDGLRLILGRLTRNRFLGATTGAVVTAVLNSSSVTTVLVVGFITAGVMTFSQSVAVIMGAARTESEQPAIVTPEPNLTLFRETGQLIDGAGLAHLLLRIDVQDENKALHKAERFAEPSSA